MNSSVNAISRDKDSARAGAELGAALRRGFGGEAPHAVIVFASSQHDYERLLTALAQECGTDVIAGASSAGEFTSQEYGDGCVSALGIRSATMRFAIGVGRNLAADPAAAAQSVVTGFTGVSSPVALPYRSALIMADALAGHTETLIRAMTLATGGNYRFFGGGAGDDGHFQRTHVFARTRAMTDAVVALEIQSESPIGVGVSHGWQPAGAGLRVTEVEGTRLIGLNGAPAVEAFEDHARATGQTFDAANPLPFFLHNILGIESGGSHRLRVPLAVNEDGSVSCAAAIPPGSIVHVMKTSVTSTVRAAEEATRAALAAVSGRPIAAALVFDCVATRMRMGQAFANEVRACADLLAPAGFIGCNTYGQIARAEGQFGGFHNCTAVVCVLPQ